MGPSQRGIGIEICLGTPICRYSSEMNTTISFPVREQPRADPRLGNRIDESNRFPSAALLFLEPHHLYHRIGSLSARGVTVADTGVHLAVQSHFVQFARLAQALLGSQSHSTCLGLEEAPADANTTQTTWPPAEGEHGPYCRR